MNFFIAAFNAILHQPLFNALVLLYEYLPGHDFGIAIIILTILIKFLLYPLGTLGIKSQRAISTLQPKIKEIQERYKGDRQKQTQATLELYRKEKINPFSGCLPLLIQLPILIALYQVFWRGFQPEQMSYLYSFVLNPGQINPYFLGVINLSQPHVALAVLTGIFQFIQSKMMLPKGSKPKTNKGAFSLTGDVLQKQMLYFFPAFTVLILWRLPSALGLYWMTTLIFSIIQQYLVSKKHPALQKND